jgi:hypothetical protein
MNVKELAEYPQPFANQHTTNPLHPRNPNPHLNNLNLGLLGTDRGQEVAKMIGSLMEMVAGERGLTILTRIPWFLLRTLKSYNNGITKLRIIAVNCTATIRQSRRTQTLHGSNEVPLWYHCS